MQAAFNRFSCSLISFTWAWLLVSLNEHLFDCYKDKIHAPVRYL